MSYDCISRGAQPWISVRASEKNFRGAASLEVVVITLIGGGLEG